MSGTNYSYWRHILWKSTILKVDSVYSIKKQNKQTKKKRSWKVNSSAKSKVLLLIFCSLIWSDMPSEYFTSLMTILPVSTHYLTPHYSDRVNDFLMRQIWIGTVFRDNWSHFQVHLWAKICSRQQWVGDCIFWVLAQSKIHLFCPAVCLSATEWSCY